MERLITVDEYVKDWQANAAVKAYLRNGGVPHQITTVEPDGARYCIKTTDGTFRRSPEELILISIREQRRTAARK